MSDAHKEEVTVPSPRHLRSGTQLGRVANQQGDTRLAVEAVALREEQTVPTRRVPEDSGDVSSAYLSNWIAGYPGPMPCGARFYRKVFANELDLWFSLVRESIVTRMFPSGAFNEATIISAENWLHVCRYLFRARIDHVYSTVSGQRPEDRVPLPGAYRVPKSISDVINCYGVKVIGCNSIRVVPRPERPPEDRAHRIASRVNHRILDQFSQFVENASQRGFINVSELSRNVQGTAAWLITTRDFNSISTIATYETKIIQAWASFSEWTPADGLHAIIMCNRFDGLVPDYLTGLRFRLHDVTDGDSLRAGFATNA